MFVVYSICGSMDNTPTGYGSDVSTILGISQNDTKSKSIFKSEQKVAPSPAWGLLRRSQAILGAILGSKHIILVSFYFMDTGVFE